MKLSFPTKIATAIALTTAFLSVPALAEETAKTQPINQEDTLHMATTEFANHHVQLWKTVDETERQVLVERLFAEDAEHYAAPANVSFIGRAAILENVTNINAQAIQTAGLKFIAGASISNGNSILVEWSAEAPNGATAQSGRDLLILNDEGKAETLYMFTSN